jgi:hypothetical protein
VFGFVGLKVLVLFATGQAASEYDGEISGSESAAFCRVVSDRHAV